MGADYMGSVGPDNTICERPRDATDHSLMAGIGYEYMSDDTIGDYKPITGDEEVGEPLDCSQVIEAEPHSRQVGGYHYIGLDPQPVDAISNWGLSYTVGTAVNYLVRAGRKGPAVEDIKKAIHMLELELAQR
jgi:hypothetical protein